MHRLQLLLMLAVLSGGCKYLGDRGLDFLDQFRIAGGVGTTIGVRGEAVGVVETGIMAGIKPNVSALGWKYGKPLFFNQSDPGFSADQAELVKATSIYDLEWGPATYKSGKSSVAVLPALLTWTDASLTEYAWTVPEEGDTFFDEHYIWSKETTKNNRYAQIHAFDVEFDVGILLYLDTGYSPGETLDFILGIFGIDIAKDDGRLGGGK